MHPLEVGGDTRGSLRADGTAWVCVVSGPAHGQWRRVAGAQASLRERERCGGGGGLNGVYARLEERTRQRTVETGGAEKSARAAAARSGRKHSAAHWKRLTKTWASSAASAAGRGEGARSA